MRALLIVGDKEEVATIPFNGSLSQIAELFSCKTIEVVKTPIPGLFMLVDEDARLTGKPTNHKAMLFNAARICGPVVLTYASVEEDKNGELDLIFHGIPDGFDWQMVAETSYDRIVASLGSHPHIEVEGR